MQIKLTSIPVNNLDNALAFYTNILGFVKKTDISNGPYRWLTVSAPEGAEGVELHLELTSFPPAQTYQEARFAAGMPIIAFISTDIHNEFNRLKAAGVNFRGEPKNMGPATAVLFEDTCGNLINLVQQNT